MSACSMVLLLKVLREWKIRIYLFAGSNTFEIFPWRPQQGKVARLLCDVQKADGSMFESDPRYVLKKVIAEAKEMGYTFDVGPSGKFFLFHTDEWTSDYIFS